jgi:hypothetical protein
MIASTIRNRILRRILTGALSAVTILTSNGAPNDAASVQINVVSVGVTQAQLDAVDKILPQSPSLGAFLQGGNYRHLYTEALESKEKGQALSAAASRFRAVFYDYTRRRTIVAEGSLGQPEAAVARVEPNGETTVDDAEFQDAVGVLTNDPDFGSALLSGAATAYRPMLPVQALNADGSRMPDRIVNVGLLPRLGSENFHHEIVGVNLGTNRIVRYPGRAPRQTSAINDTTCGARPAGQSTTRRGTAGQYQLTVTDIDGTVLWDMLVLRPSISSGTNASGIELRDVKYKGHSVLKRAHVPILNVQYVDGVCGPYRDWLYQEGMFQATGTDIAGAPGFRDCGTTPATTELETGNDEGNFRGVALYREGSEVVLVTELEAGWYRYVHEWRFDLNGTIHPRFGFGATANSCTCFSHTHHAYFRFDFDIDGTDNSISQLPLGANPDRNDSRIGTERKIYRAGNPPQYYRIRGGKRSYLLYPGPNDGAADSYAHGDMWFLHWHDGPTNLTAEIDDGHGFFDPTDADLDQFLTNESLQKQDSVIWYHASFFHTPDNEADGLREGARKPGPSILSGPEVVGPDLVPDGF